VKRAGGAHIVPADLDEDEDESEDRQRERDEARARPITEAGNDENDAQQGDRERDDVLRRPPAHAPLPVACTLASRRPNRLRRNGNAVVATTSTNIRSVTGRVNMKNGP